MKQIPNQQFTATDSTVTLLRNCIENGGKQGVALSDLRARNRVADALDKVESGGILELEDADYATAQACVRDVRWIKFEKHLITFAEQFAL